MGSMSNLLDLLIAGLATGAIYALVAVGFTLLWQTSQTINFAQGEFVMLPAFLMLAAMHRRRAVLAGDPDRHSSLSLLLLGLRLQAAAGRSDAAHGVLPLAIATMALSIVHQGSREATSISAEAIAVPVAGAGRRHRTSSAPWCRCRVSACLRWRSLAVVGAAPRSSTAPAPAASMQAAAQNPTVARILGIPVERMIL